MILPFCWAIGIRSSFFGDALVVYLELAEDGREFDGLLLDRGHDLRVKNAGHKGRRIELFGRLDRLDLGDRHDGYREWEDGNEPDHEYDADNKWKISSHKQMSLFPMREQTFETARTLDYTFYASVW